MASLWHRRCSCMEHLCSGCCFSRCCCSCRCLQVAGARDPGKPKMACYVPNTILHRDDLRRARGPRNAVLAAPLANHRLVSERTYQTITQVNASWWRPRFCPFSLVGAQPLCCHCSRGCWDGFSQDIEGWCSEGRTVLISSEDFCGLSVQQWAPLIKLCGQVRRSKCIECRAK